MGVTREYVIQSDSDIKAALKDDKMLKNIASDIKGLEKSSVTAKMDDMSSAANPLVVIQKNLNEMDALLKKCQEYIKDCFTKYGVQAAPKVAKMVVDFSVEVNKLHDAYSKQLDKLHQTPRIQVSAEAFSAVNQAIANHSAKGSAKPIENAKIAVKPSGLGGYATSDMFVPLNKLKKPVVAEDPKQSEEVKRAKEIATEASTRVRKPSGGG